ncbi:MAG: hypothetical protein ACRDYX_14805 [Egibacteraceae bacterium]
MICELFEVPWEERDQLGFPVPVVGEPVPATALSSGLILNESLREVLNGLTLVNGQCSVCGNHNGAAGVAKNGKPHQEGIKAKRCEFMQLVRAFACTPVPLDALERLSAYFERPRAVDEALVRDVERLTAAVGAAYDATAPRRLLVPARLLVNRTARLLEGSMFGSERERLMRCASEGALVIGWLRFNLDERADARAYFLLTQELAHETPTPDDLMQARALGALSCAHSTIYQGGNAAKAFESAEQANAVLPEHAPAGVCSWLAIREAVEHAASSDASEYGRLMERAEVAGSQAQSELGLFGGWDEGVLNGHKGTCLWLLNKSAEAEQILLDGLKHSSLARPRANMASSLAGVYTLQDDAEAACTMARQALGFVLEVKYVVGLQRLLVVREGFPDDWTELSYVQELDEQLRVAVRRVGG